MQVRRAVGRNRVRSHIRAFDLTARPNWLGLVGSGAAPDTGPLGSTPGAPLNAHRNSNCAESDLFVLTRKPRLMLSLSSRNLGDASAR